jgi:hypothetical protein
MADKKKRTEKSDAVLAKEHLEKTAHFVDKVDDWMTKLIKAVNSRKHPLTDAQKERVSGAIGELYDRYEASLRAKESIEEKGFEF